MSLKNSHYAYIPLYMHKTLPTLGNEKEQYQIKFYEKSLGELIFSWATKISKCSISLARLGECSKSKVTPLHDETTTNLLRKVNHIIVSQSRTGIDLSKNMYIFYTAMEKM